MSNDGIIDIKTLLDTNDFETKSEKLKELANSIQKELSTTSEQTKNTWISLSKNFISDTEKIISALKTCNAAFQAGANNVSILATALATYQIVVYGVSTVTQVATMIQKLFNVSLQNCPVGALIGGFTVLVSFLGILSQTIQGTVQEFDILIQESDKLIEKNTEAIQSAKDLIQKQKETQEAHKSETTEIALLGSEIEALSAKENKTIGEKRQLISLIDQLNERIPELNLAYNEQTDFLNMSIDALKNYINISKEQVFLEDAIKNRIDLLKKEKEQSELLEEIQKERNKIEVQYSILEEKGPQYEEDGYPISRVYWTQRQLYKDKYLEPLNKKIKELEEAENECQATLNELQNTSVDNQKDIDKYSEILSSREKYSKSIQKQLEQEKHLLEEINSLTEEYADIATNAFDKLEQKSGVTLSSMLDNLKANQKAIQDWKFNMSILEEKDILSPDLIQYLYDLGPTYAPVIEQAIKEWGTGAREQLLELQDMLLEGIDLSKSTATQQITDENSPELVDGRIQNTGAMWQAGVSIDQQFADGMSSSDSSRQAAAEKVEQVYQTVDGRIVQNGVIMQENAGAIDAQLAEGISQGSQAETAAANKVDSMYSVVNGRIVQNGVAMPEVGIGFNEQVSSMVAQLLAPSIQLIQGTGEEIRTVLQGFLSWLESQYTVIIINWRSFFLSSGTPAFTKPPKWRKGCRRSSTGFPEWRTARATA